MGGEVRLGGEGPAAHLTVVLGLVGVQALHVGLQGRQVPELLGAVAAPERLRLRPGAAYRNCKINVIGHIYEDEKNAATSGIKVKTTNI